MKKILTRLECQRKAFFEEQHFPIQPAKALVIKQTIMQAIKEVGFWGVALDTTKAKYFDTLDDSLFLLKKEKELELEVVQTQLSRMLFYFKMNDFDFVDSQVKASKTYTNYFEGLNLKDDLTLKKQFDLVLEKDGDYYVCKLSRRAPELTFRNSKNSVSNSIELMLMQILGEALYPGRRVIPMIISLTSKDESSTTTLASIEKTPFESKQGKNLFFHYFEEYPAEMCKMVTEAANYKIDYKATRNCNMCSECEYENVCGYDNTEDVPLEKIPFQEKAVGIPVFTPAQKEIITFRKGNARVLAGAGSGKTTVLINRVLTLLAMNPELKPEDFLMITFTEKGVCEMKDKLVYWLVKDGYPKTEADKFNVFTFNGFGQKVLDENYRLLGFESKPRLIERIEQIDIIRDILEDTPIIPHYNYRNPLLEMFKAKGVVHAVTDMIIKMKEKNIYSLYQFKSEFKAEDVGHLVDKTQLLYEFDYENFYDMYQKYIKVLKDRNLIDYPDQLHLTIRLLENHDLGKQYPYQHIILDEFQDTSKEQVLLIKQIRETSGKVKSLLVCGDDAQAIFAFRGVGIENILEFPNYFDGSITFEMVDNFRSSEQIVNLANEIIEFSPMNLKKDLIATRQGAIPTFVVNDDSIKYIARAVEEKIKNGIKCEDIAVIARTRNELKEINDLLKKKGIPSIMSVSERLIDNQRIIGVISLARFLKNPEDTESLMRWLEVSDYDTFINEADLSKYVGIQKEVILEEVKDLDEIKLLSWLKLKILELKCVDRAVDKLMDILNGFTEFTPAQVYLHKMEAYNSEISVELDDAAYKAVTLTTVHSAKGREFRHVLVAYNKFKAERFSKESKSLVLDDAEEVRLLFVAVTRAMDFLTVVSDSESMMFKPTSKNIKWIDVRKEV